MWKTEQGFWLDGPAFYEANMAPEALMVFPAPVGILKGPAILEGLRGAPRWQSVVLSEKHLVSLGDTMALAYHATAKRDGAEPYAAHCSSTYVRAGEL